MTVRVPVHPRTTCGGPMPTGRLSPPSVALDGESPDHSAGMVLGERFRAGPTESTSGPLQKTKQLAPAVHHSC
jgi:hypothetical protein